MRPVPLLAIVLLTAALAWPSGMLVVSDEQGRVRWRVPVAEGSPVVLQYTNSIYLAPVWERFVVRAGRLELVSVSSTREAVLEYNRLAPPFVWEGPRVTAGVKDVSLAVLPLRIGERGHPTLDAGGVSLPLYQAGSGTALRISLRHAPRLFAWIGARAP